MYLVVLRHLGIALINNSGSQSQNNSVINTLKNDENRNVYPCLQTQINSYYCFILGHNS